WPRKTPRCTSASNKMLAFDKRAWENLQKACEAGYPREVCGLLFGSDGMVSKIEVLSNVLDEKYKARLEALLNAGTVNLPKERLGRGGAFEFLIDPEEHY